MNIRAFFAALLMLAATSVPAADSPLIVVEGVQMPGWVEHASGARDPLAIGKRLVDSDRIYTGPGARALLRLADGSLVKLGENAILALDDLGRKKVNMRDLVTASLDVVKGAFRFTTQVLYKFRGDRDVRVRIATITTGIRGTDLWGKADDNRDLVCLIEGKITVIRAEEAFTMDQPMSFYVAPKNKPAEPVAKVSQKQLDDWATETEIAAGKGAIRKGGKWRVYLAEVGTQDEALKIYDDLRTGGYAAEIRPLRKEDATTFRVRISNLMSKPEAAALGDALKGRFGITKFRVSQ